MNDLPTPPQQDDKTLLIGADGELIPEDEQGKPVYLSGAPMIKTDEATIIARVLYVVAIGIVLFYLCGIPSVLLPPPWRTTADDPTAVVRAARSTPLPPTAAPTRVSHAADIQMCTRTYAKSIYVQIEADNADRFIVSVREIGTVCHLLLHDVPDEVIRFDADGSGAIFYSLATKSYYHGRFADGHIYAEPYLDPPQIPAPRWRSADGRIYMQEHFNELWLYPIGRATTVLEMPWWVTNIVWAEWVSSDN